MAFDNVRMDVRLSLGFTSVLDFGTDVVPLARSVAEERVSTRQTPGRRWHAAKNKFNRDNVESWRRFILARRGAFRSFRFFDWSDYKTNFSGPPTGNDQLLGYGDGTTRRFPLRVQYPTVGNPTLQAVRDDILPIHQEVDSALNAALGLAPNTQLNLLVSLGGVATTAFALDLRARDVVLAVAPAVDVSVTMGCYFDNVARLGETADEDLELVLDGVDHVTVPNIPIVGLPFERLLPENDDPGGWFTSAMPEDVFAAKIIAKYYELAPTSPKNFHCEDPNDIGPGGPHYVVWNTGSAAITVRDHLGTSLGTVAPGFKKELLLKETGGNKNWVLS